MSLRKVFVKIKFCSESGSGSWYYFGFQYQTYISYIEDTHQILFGTADSFGSYCVHMKSPRTYSQTTRQTDRQTEFFFARFFFTDIQNMNIRQKERIFFFTHVLTIRSLFTYSVCDEKVKRFMTRKMWKTLYEFFKRMNIGLCEFYQNIRYETAISDFQLLSLDL